MTTPSSATNQPTDILGNDQKSVRFVDPPNPFDRESSSSELFEAPIRRMSEPDLRCGDDNAESALSGAPRDPEVYCTARRGRLPEDGLREGITKADGSPVQSILKTGKISIIHSTTGSDSSLASNPWNLARDSTGDMVAPLIPQRHLSEDSSTNDNLDLEAPLNAADQVNIARPTRRESNRDVFLRQFIRKT